MADEVRNERRSVEAAEHRDVTFSQFLRLALAMLREFITDPRADAIVREWRGQLDGRTDRHA